MGKIFFLSYPGSGTHWLLYCIEKLGRIKTFWEGGSRAVFENPKLLSQDKYDKNYVIHATHLCWKENGIAFHQKNNHGLIAIVRNYKEAVVKKKSRHDSVLNMKNIFYDLEGRENIIEKGNHADHDYIRILKKYHFYKNPKILIYYEDLLENPERELIKIVKFLNKNFGSYYNRPEIENFVNNLEPNKKDCLERYSKTIEKPSTFGDKNKLNFHQNKIKEGQRLEIDEFIQKKYPLLYNKYLIRYGEIEKDIDIFNKEYDYIIPIGINCRIATALDKIEKRKAPFPFDWGFFSLPTVYKVFCMDFEGFMDEKNIKHYTFKDEKIIDNFLYNAAFPHEKGYSEGVKKKYDKRIKSLIEILKSNKSILFVHNLLDCEVNDESLAINLEKMTKVFPDQTNDYKILYDIYDLIKTKYTNLDFNILCVYYGGKGKFESNNKITFVYFDKSKYDIHDIFDHDACKHYLSKVKLKK